MKRILISLAFCLVSSCGIVQDELYQTGGFVGAQANSFLPAETPIQRFDRYMIIAMILAPTALETAVDEEEAAATIRRVNSMYASLAELRLSLNCGEGVPIRNGDPMTTTGYTVVCNELQVAPVRNSGAPDLNWGTLGDEIRTNGYAFEQLENDVQQDLFFVARSVVTNLDLDTDPERLLRLNALTLAGLWSKVDDLLPMFRATAARFRGGIILYADISQQSCTDNRAASDCQRLRSLMRQQYRGIPRNGIVEDPNLPERNVRRMLVLAKQVFDGQTWQLSDPQYAAIIQQIDASCEVAFHRQSGPDAEANRGARPHCGFAGPEKTDANGPSRTPAASPARNDLIQAIQDVRFAQVVASPTTVEDDKAAEDLSGAEADDNQASPVEGEAAGGEG